LKLDRRGNAGREGRRMPSAGQSRVPGASCHTGRGRLPVGERIQPAQLRRRRQATGRSFRHSDHSRDHLHPAARFGDPGV